MRTSQIREMSSDEREQQYRELTEELFHLRFQAGSGQLEKPHRIRQIKRDLARLLTIRKENADEKSGNTPTPNG